MAEAFKLQEGKLFEGKVDRLLIKLTIYRQEEIDASHSALA